MIKLYPAQQAQVDKAQKNWFYRMKMGTGKALPNSLDIPTPNGFVKNGNLKVGDLVFDRLGKPTKITGVYPQGFQDQYEIELTDGRKIICSGSHLWTFRVENAKTWQTKTTKEIIELGVSRKSTQGYTINRIKLPNAESVQYEAKKLPIDPYILGVFLGDGCLSERYLTISSDDEYIVAKIAEKLGAKQHKNSENNFSWTFYRDGKLILTEDIFGKLSGLKAIDKYIPECFKTSSIEQRWDLIKGLFDTDGYVKNNNRLNISYSSVSEKLVGDIREIIYSIGFSSTIQIDKRLDDLHKHFVYELIVKSEYQNKHKFFSLPRKLEIIYGYSNDNYENHKKTDYSVVRIKNITKLDGQVEMTCIEVDNEEHLYLAGRNYIVTHNTYVAIAHYLKHAADKKVIVIAPKAVYDDKSWQRAFDDYDVPSDRYKVVKPYAITQLGKKGAALSVKDFYDAFIIIDEAHQYKSTSAKRTKSLIKALKATFGFILLSGTPIDGKWDNLEAYALMFGHKATPKAFKDTYKTPVAYPYAPYPIWEVKRNVSQLQEWWHSVTSDEVALEDVAELPSVISRDRWFKAARGYSRSNYNYKKDDKLIFETPQERHWWRRQNQNTAAKQNWLSEVLPEYKEDGVIIFYNTNQEYEAIVDMVGKEPFDVINGSERRKNGAKIIIINIASGGAGLTLNEYKHAVWWSLPYSFTQFDQSLYRNYRIGQDKKITRDFLLVDKTIDNDIKAALDDKKDFNDKL